MSNHSKLNLSFLWRPPKETTEAFDTDNAAMSRRKKTQPLDYQTFEDRRLLAVTVTLDAGELTIRGDSAPNEVAVNQHHDSIFVEHETTFVDQIAPTFTRNMVDKIVFLGGDGDDSFINLTDIPTDARGHGGNDILTGGTGNDVLFGGDGNDQLHGSNGDDQMVGGNGHDLIWAGDGIDHVWGGYGEDVIYGGLGNDFLAGDWDDDTIRGGQGDDFIVGYDGQDVLYGDDGNDKIYGQSGSDTIYGGDGNDVARGGKENDLLEGGSDDDYMLGDRGDDEMHGGIGNDTMLGYDGDDLMRGGAGNDSMYGQSGNDDLGGGDGNDLLRGGRHDDFLQGMDGQDRLVGDDGNDRIYGGADNDILLGNAGNDHLDGQSGADQLYGQADHDLLRGGADDDLLWGGEGTDSLFGGHGNDIDRLWGEAGDDRFLLQGSDRIQDRSAEDAAIEFINDSSQWSDKEIEVLDLGFAQLHDRTGNTRLLKDSIPTMAPRNGLPAGTLKFIKASKNSMGNALAWNWLRGSDREIRFADWNETADSNNVLMQSIAIHEIAHNWDQESELTTASGTLAGWTTGFRNLSHWSGPYNGNWHHTHNASFASDYGKTDPFEDVATTWQYVFSGKTTNDPKLQTKLDHVNTLFDKLS